MNVELANDLKEHMDPEKTGLGVAASYVTEKELLGGYLNRSFGNAYDFDQVEKVEGVL